MTPAFRLALRWLLSLAAAAVIVLALLVGLVRLLLPLAPEYQQQIRQRVNAATGYQLEFGSISASWPVVGPEVSFYDVSLTPPGGTTPLLEVRELSAGISLLRLLRDQQISLSRLSLTGTRVEIERDAAGQLRLQGRLLDELLPPRRETGVQALDVVLEDIGVNFTDRQRQRAAFPFRVDSLAASMRETEITVDADLELDPRYGETLQAALAFPVTPGKALTVPTTWSGRLSSRDLDVAALLSHLFDQSIPLGSARGDLSITAEFAGEHRRSVVVDADLREITIGSGATASNYDAVSGNLQWARSTEGWDVVASGVRMRRGPRAWPVSTMELHYRHSTETMPAQWVSGASFARLEDLLPLAQSLLTGTEWAQSLPRALSGDVRDLTAEFSAEAEAPARFSLRGAFEGISLTSATGDFSATNLSGSVAADDRGGRLQLASERPSLDLQQWFAQPVAADRLEGLLTWSSGADGIRLQGSDIRVNAPGLSLQSRLQFAFPADRSSPLLDLEATAVADVARDALRFLPLRRFPPPTVAWLERAVVGGQIPRATVRFKGPVRDFPFDKGEGQFRLELDLENGTLDYADGWPHAEELNGTLVFDGVGMYSTQNKARVGNLRVTDYSVRMPDLRQGVLALAGRQRVALDQILVFLRSTPLESALGPTLARVTGSGPVDTSLRLALPLKKLANYDLKVLFDARGCNLAWQGLDFGFEKVQGRARLQNTQLTARRLTGVLLQAPVEMTVSPVTEPGSPVSHLATVLGITPVPRVMSTFRLPLPEQFSGQLDWTATVRIPARRGPGAEPLRIGLSSDMVGVASALPAPLAKPSEQVWPMNVELAFPRDGVIDINGSLSQPDHGWSLRLVSSASGWSVERGALVAGGRSAILPDSRGVTLAGRMGRLNFGDWLELGEEGGDGRQFRELYREARLKIDRFGIIGQTFPDTELTARRGRDGWTVDVASPNATGRVRVPFDLRGSQPVALDMQRLWLVEDDTAGGSDERPDPRDMPALEVKATDAALGTWRFGALELSAARASDGLVVRRIATRAASFNIDGDGAWQVERESADRQYTRLKFALASNNVKDTLVQLGYDPVIDAKGARVGVDIVWPDAPGGDFLQQASGEINVAIDNGQVLNLEPGSGRLLGLLSVTALPRRLALDFRDVFNKGLAFDAIRGDFRLSAGSAWTCNLGLEGPAASLAMVGKTGLVNRDYEQLAVVRPEVSNVLAVGGAVLGGPVGGATMLLISQLFRKPLSTLGESYYRMTGPWDAPVVTRIQRSEADVSEFKDCERELAATLQAIEDLPEAAILPGPAESQQSGAGQP
jgi:uncharacterized protein (TIGR02099 family)